MALGHRYTESSCNAEAWLVLAGPERPHHRLHIPLQPLGQAGGGGGGGGGGFGIDPVLLRGLLLTALHKIPRRAQGPREDTKTDLTSDGFMLK